MALSIFSASWSNTSGRWSQIEIAISVLSCSIAARCARLSASSSSRISSTLLRMKTWSSASVKRETASPNLFIFWLCHTPNTIALTIPKIDVTNAVLIPPRRPLILEESAPVLLVSTPARPIVNPIKVPKMPIPVKVPANPDQSPPFMPSVNAATEK